jgi:hypothetical protein
MASAHPLLLWKPGRSRFNLGAGDEAGRAKGGEEAGRTDRQADKETGMVIKLVSDKEPADYFIPLAAKETLKVQWMADWKPSSMEDVNGSYWQPYGPPGGDARVLTIVERGESIVIGQGVTAFLMNDEGKTIDRV